MIFSAQLLNEKETNGWAQNKRHAVSCASSEPLPFVQLIV